MCDQTIGPNGLFREPAKEFSGIGCLAHRIGAGFAVLHGDQMRKVIQTRSHEFPRFAKDLGAFAGGARGPLGHSGFSCIKGSFGVGYFGRGDRCNDFLGGGVQNVETLALGAFAPCAVNIEISVFHVRLHGLKQVAERVFDPTCEIGNQGNRFGCCKVMCATFEGYRQTASVVGKRQDRHIFTPHFDA